MCVADDIFGQEEGVTPQFLLMRFFYDNVFLFTIQCSSPSKHVAFNSLFQWKHFLCAPEGAERRWAASGENSLNGRTWQGPLWNFEQKMALTLRPPPQVYYSPSSTQTNIIIKTVSFGPETTFISRQWLRTACGSSNLKP